MQKNSDSEDYLFVMDRSNLIYTMTVEVPGGRRDKSESVKAGAFCAALL